MNVRGLGARPIAAVERPEELSEVSSIPMDLFYLTAPEGRPVGAPAEYRVRRQRSGRVELRLPLDVELAPGAVLELPKPAAGGRWLPLISASAARGIEVAVGGEVISTPELGRPPLYGAVTLENTTGRPIRIRDVRLVGSTEWQREDTYAIHRAFQPGETLSLPLPLHRHDEIIDQIALEYGTGTYADPDEEVGPMPDGWPVYKDALQARVELVDGERVRTLASAKTIELIEVDNVEDLEVRGRELRVGIFARYREGEEREARLPRIRVRYRPKEEVGEVTRFGRHGRWIEPGEPLWVPVDPTRPIQRVEVRWADRGIDGDRLREEFSLGHVRIGGERTRGVNVESPSTRVFQGLGRIAEDGRIGLGFENGATKVRWVRVVYEGDDPRDPVRRLSPVPAVSEGPKGKMPDEVVEANARLLRVRLSAYFLALGNDELAGALQELDSDVEDAPAPARKDLPSLASWLLSPLLSEGRLTRAELREAVEETFEKQRNGRKELRTFDLGPIVRVVPQAGLRGTFEGYRTQRSYTRPLGSSEIARHTLGDPHGFVLDRLGDFIFSSIRRGEADRVHVFEGDPQPAIAAMAARGFTEYRRYQTPFTRRFRQLLRFEDPRRGAVEWAIVDVHGRSHLHNLERLLEIGDRPGGGIPPEKLRVHCRAEDRSAPIAAALERAGVAPERLLIGYPGNARRQIALRALGRRYHEALLGFGRRPLEDRIARLGARAERLSSTNPQRDRGRALVDELSAIDLDTLFAASPAEVFQSASLSRQVGSVAELLVELDGIMPLPGLGRIRRLVSHGRELDDRSFFERLPLEEVDLSRLVLERPDGIPVEVFNARIGFGDLTADVAEAACVRGALKEVILAGTCGGLRGGREVGDVTFADRLGSEEVENLLRREGDAPTRLTSVDSVLDETELWLKQAREQGDDVVDVESEHLHRALKDRGVAVGFANVVTDLPGSEQTAESIVTSEGKVARSVDAVFDRMISAWGATDAPLGMDDSIGRQNPALRYAPPRRVPGIDLRQLARGDDVLEKVLELADRHGVTVGVWGGTARDLILGRNRGDYSDVDLVVDSREPALDAFRRDVARLESSVRKEGRWLKLDVAVDLNPESKKSYQLRLLERGLTFDKLALMSDGTLFDATGDSLRALEEKRIEYFDDRPDQDLNVAFVGRIAKMLDRYPDFSLAPSSERAIALTMAHKYGPSSIRTKTIADYNAKLRAEHGWEHSAIPEEDLYRLYKAYRKDRSATPGAVYLDLLVQLRKAIAGTNDPAHLHAVLSDTGLGRFLGQIGSSVELDALRSKLPATPEDRFVAEQKARLSRLRKALEKSIGERDALPASKAAKIWTAHVDSLLGDLDARIVEELGPPPSSPETGEPLAYSLFATGSYARMELSAYSDLDYGILLESSDPEIRRYFETYSRRLRELLERIESDGGLRPCREMSPTGYFGQAFVGTPEEISRRAAGKSEDMQLRPLRDRVYIASGLTHARLVLGRQGGSALFGQLQRQMRASLGPAHPSIDRDSPRFQRVLEILPQMREPFGLPDEMPGWLEVPANGEALTEGAFWKKEGPKHQAIAPEEAIAQGKVNVKHDLLRCFQIPFQALRLLYDLDATDTIGAIEELEARELIDPVFAKKLRSAFDGIQQMRMENHFAAEKSEDRLAELTEERVRTIQKAVPILYRLRQELRTLDRADPNRFDLR